jgi:hypothetical protein
MQDALILLILPALGICFLGVALGALWVHLHRETYGVDDGEMPPRARNRVFERGSGACLARQRSWGNHRWQ